MATNLKLAIGAIHEEANRKIFQAIKDDFAANKINLYILNLPSRLEGIMQYGSWSSLLAYGEYNGMVFKISFSQSGYTFDVSGLSSGCMGADSLIKKLSKAGNIDIKKSMFDDIFLRKKFPL